MPARCLGDNPLKAIIGHPSSAGTEPLASYLGKLIDEKRGKKSMPFTKIISQIELSSMVSLLFTLRKSELEESVCSALGSQERQVTY